MRIKRATLAPAEDNAKTRQPRAGAKRARGKAHIHSAPAQGNIASSTSRAGAGIQTAPQPVREFAQTSRADAAEAARSYSEQGNQVAGSRGKGAPIAEMASSKMIRTAETILAFIPSAPPEITAAEEDSLSFGDSSDPLPCDWNMQTRPMLEYVPGNIEFTVEQYPEVIIEYIGSPIYVPASADPNYEE